MTAFTQDDFMECYEPIPTLPSPEEVAVTVLSDWVCGVDLDRLPNDAETSALLKIVSDAIRKDRETR